MAFACGALGPTFIKSHTTFSMSIEFVRLACPSGPVAESNKLFALCLRGRGGGGGFVCHGVLVVRGLERLSCIRWRCSVGIGRLLKLMFLGGFFQGC